jgi:hypothetical protein
MRTIRVFLSRLKGSLQERRKEHELAEELESHLAMQIEDNLRSGTASAPRWHWRAHGSTIACGEEAETAIWYEKL